MGFLVQKAGVSHGCHLGSINKVDLVVCFPTAVNDLSYQVIAGHFFSLLFKESRVEPVTLFSSTVITFLYCFFMQTHKRFSSSHALGFLWCNPTSPPETPAARGIQSNLARKRKTLAVTLWWWFISCKILCYPTNLYYPCTLSAWYLNEENKYYNKAAVSDVSVCLWSCATILNRLPFSKLEGPWSKWRIRGWENGLSPL